MRHHFVAFHEAFQPMAARIMAAAAEAVREIVRVEILDGVFMGCVHRETFLATQQPVANGDQSSSERLSADGEIPLMLLILGPAL